MVPFIINPQVRWADLDPNFHVRHSVYYDWGAQCRIAFLDKFGLTAGVMHGLQIGPVLFREECVFKKEVRYGDDLQISLELLKSKRDFSRWTIRHTIQKEHSATAAIIKVDGAWLHTVERKLAIPPEQAKEVIARMPLATEFEWIG